MATLTFDALRRDTRIKGFPFQVAEYINRYTKRCYDQCFLATETMAKHFECSERTIQRALRCLKLAGHIAVEVTRRVNSGHIITIFWRAAASIFPSMRAEIDPPLSAPNASTNDHIDATPATVLSPEAGVPPDPPIKVSEDRSMGGRTDCPGAGSPASGHPAPGEGESSSSPTPESFPTEEGDPEPAVVAVLVQEAASVLGTGPAVEGRIRSWARQWCPDWVRKALGVTASKAGRVENPVGYTVGVLKRFEAEGGPVETPTQAAPTPEEEAAAWAFILGPSPGAGP